MEGFQTIADFLNDPFGNGNPSEQKRLEGKYQEIKSGIKINGYTIVDGDYFVHVSIPSSSNKNQSYDVVILFFTDNSKVERELTLSNYYVKFFSNSPSFIYQYAVLYKVNGFLIDFLYDKMDQAYIDKEPQKPKKLMYDKSIYAACQYLLTGTTAALSKLGLVTRKKKTKEKFFKDIKTFEDVKLTGELNTLDKKIDKELEENKKIRKDARNKHRSLDKHRKNAKKDTLAPNVKKSITMAKKIKRVKKVTGKRPISKRRGN